MWSATQYPQGLQRDVAALLRVPASQVRVMRFEGAGCYGRLSANYDDAATEAVVLSQADRLHVHPGAVQCRPHLIVHRRIHNNKVLGPR